jgi:predicted transcriptional regulator of viral defense system
MSIENEILNVLKKKGKVSLHDLYSAIPGCPKHSIRSKTSVLAKRGVLRKVSKGVYELADYDAREKTKGTSKVAEDTTAVEDTPSEGDAVAELEQRVLRLLRRSPDATPEEIAEVLDTQADTIRGIIGGLIDKGLLEPIANEAKDDTPEVSGKAERAVAERTKDDTSKNARCFYAPICHDIPGMRKVCESIGSVLCEG